jgi:hypothetical protein
MRSFLLLFTALAVSEISCFHVTSNVQPHRVRVFRETLPSLAQQSTFNRRALSQVKGSQTKGLHRKFRRPRTLLNLFPINFSGGNGNGNGNESKSKSTTKKKKDEEEPDTIDEDSDFSVWVEGLRQWPLYPSSEVVDVEEKEVAKRDSARSSGRYRGLNPLNNFIKFEAVLDLASGPNKTEPYFTNIFAAADQLFKTINDRENEDISSDLADVTTVEELIEREKWMENIQKTIGAGAPFDASDINTRDILARLSLTQTSAITSSNASQASLGKAAEAIVKEATARIEYLVSEASTALTPKNVQDLIVRASQVFSSNGTTSVEAVTNDIVQAAESIAKDRGLDVQFARDRARETTRYAANMVTVANSVFGAGYAYGSRSGAAGSEESPLSGFVSIQQVSKPLFADFVSAGRIEPFQYETVVAKGAEMGILAGAIYEDALPKCHKLGHSLVANGTTAEVAWMVTDSIDYESRFVEPKGDQQVEKRPIFVRTITIRGFDASDDTVDRESLLNTICTAASEPMNSDTSNIVFHSGLLSTARELYTELKKYIEWASPNHKIVMNGHSIGGSLSVLMLLLLTCEYGGKPWIAEMYWRQWVMKLTFSLLSDEYVRDRVLRVYTHGMPPIAMATKPGPTTKRKTVALEQHQCPILEAFNLPATMVYAYIQPYVSFHCCLVCHEAPPARVHVFTNNNCIGTGSHCPLPH